MADIEKGVVPPESSRIPNDSEDQLDEYSGLIKYISTYRDEREQVVEEEEEDDESSESAPWYAPWKKGKSGLSTFAVPDVWITTDIKQGLSSAEVENRRKKTGFNELTSEKENLFLKFLGFFTGPILYGE
jgi:H+-transporting ATPase